MTGNSYSYLPVVYVPIDQEALSDILGTATSEEAERIYSGVAKSMSLDGQFHSRFRWPNIFDILLHVVQDALWSFGALELRERCAEAIVDLMASVVTVLEEERLTWRAFITDPSGLLFALKECRSEIGDICDEFLRTNLLRRTVLDLAARVKNIVARFNTYLLKYWGLEMRSVRPHDLDQFATRVMAWMPLSPNLQMLVQAEAADRQQGG